VTEAAPIVYECDQGGDLWHSLRCGAITASMFAEARARLKTGKDKGKPTQAARDYAFRLAIERISGDPLDEGFQTYQMRRGNELEPAARELHGFAYGLDIDHAGFVLTADRRFGASADGLIGDDGGSEYKCFVSPEKLRPILLENDTSSVVDQVQGCMWITGRSWWHFALYCPALEPIGRELTVIPMERDDEHIEAMEADLLAFDRLVQEYEDTLRQTPETVPGLDYLSTGIQREAS